MGELVSVSPELHFGYECPFQVSDGFNGPARGTWWFRSKGTGELIGPFHSRTIALMKQKKEDMSLGLSQ